MTLRRYNSLSESESVDSTNTVLEFCFRAGSTFRLLSEHSAIDCDSIEYAFDFDSVAFLRDMIQLELCGLCY